MRFSGYMLMRILYVVTAAELGGAPVHLYHLMNYMVNQEFDVGLVCGLEPWLLQKAKDLGVKIFPNPYFTQSLSRPDKDFRSIGSVIHAIKAFRPTLIHAHSTKAGFAARISGAVLKFRPTVFTAHGWAFAEGHFLLKRWILAQAERLAARVTDKIICVSEQDRKLALQFRVASPEKLTVVHNGVNPEPFLQADGAQVKSELGLAGKIVTFVGRLAAQKDPMILLRAFQSVPKGTLLLVGDGGLKPQIESYIHRHGLSNRVKICGVRNDIPQVLAASDVFALPSRWEGLPFTVIEAMMVGLPVVASRVGGVPELVEDGVTGLIVPPKDPEALAKALNTLLSDHDLRHQMGEAGRQKAMREFTLERMLRETQSVYDGVLSNVSAASPGS